MVEADMLRGEWVDPRSGQTSFSEWVDQWLRANPAKRPTTLARDESVLRTHFAPLLGPRPLASITRLDVRRTVDVMTATVSPATARTNYGVLSAVFNAAVEADMIARSPCRGIVLATAPRRERPTLSPEELARLAAELPERYRPMVYLAGVLGLRWSEIVGLRLQRVNFLDRTLTVSETVAEVGGKLLIGADTKSRASQRTIAVPPFILEMLAEHLARRGRPGPDEFVFLGPKGGLLRRSFEARHFLPAAERAGLDGLSFHGLRHAAASLLIESGEHPRVVQHRLGHATARLSMELYSHVSNASDRAVASRLEERFSNRSGTQRAREGSDDGK
jgi:integrase